MIKFSFYRIYFTPLSLFPSFYLSSLSLSRSLCLFLSLPFSPVQSLSPSHSFFIFIYIYIYIYIDYYAVRKITNFLLCVFRAKIRAHVCDVLWEHSKNVEFRMTSSPPSPLPSEILPEAVHARDFCTAPSSPSPSPSSSLSLVRCNIVQSL